MVVVAHNRCLYWSLRSALAGNATAQYSVGYHYSAAAVDRASSSNSRNKTNYGNVALAFCWWNHAAAQESDNSLYSLAVWTRVVTRNKGGEYSEEKIGATVKKIWPSPEQLTFKRVYELIRFASFCGSESASATLAAVFEDGSAANEFCERDLRKSVEFYRTGAEAMDRDCIDRLRNLSNGVKSKLLPNDIDEEEDDTWQAGGGDGGGDDEDENEEGDDSQDGQSDEDGTPPFEDDEDDNPPPQHHQHQQQQQQRQQQQQQQQQMGYAAPAPAAPDSDDEPPPLDDD